MTKPAILEALTAKMEEIWNDDLSFEDQAAAVLELVGPKPLVWEAYAQGEISRPNDVHPEYCTAPSVSKERAGEWRLRGPWIGFNYYPTKEAAQAAAQAHADAAHWANCPLGKLAGVV